MACRYCGSKNIVINAFDEKGGICGSCAWNLECPEWGHRMIDLPTQHTPYPPDVEAYRQQCKAQRS